MIKTKFVFEILPEKLNAKKTATQVIIISMKFLFSVIKIYRLLNFIFAITDYGKHIKQLLSTGQWHPWLTITQLQAITGGVLLGSLLSVRDPGRAWSRRFVSKELSYF